MLENYVSITEASKETRLSRSTIHRYIQDGNLPAKRVGKRKRMVNLSDLRKLIADK